MYVHHAPVCLVPLEVRRYWFLELRMLVSHCVSARTKHGSSTRAINALDHWAVSSNPGHRF